MVVRQERRCSPLLFFAAELLLFHKDTLRTMPNAALRSKPAGRQEVRSEPLLGERNNDGNGGDRASSHTHNAPIFSSCHAIYLILRVLLSPFLPHKIHTEGLPHPPTPPSAPPIPVNTSSSWAICSPSPPVRPSIHSLMAKSFGSLALVRAWEEPWPLKLLVGAPAWS